MKQEEFRILPNYIAYRVSNLGNIQTRWQRGAFYNGFECEDIWKDLPTHIDDNGYKYVHLADGKNAPKRMRIHRIIASLFLPIPIDKKMLVRHLDGNKLNNAANNLAWGTHKDNEEDKRRHGTYNMRIGGAKVTKENVIEIRELASQGISQKELAKRYSVSRETITRIVNKTIWRNV